MQIFVNFKEFKMIEAIKNLFGLGSRVDYSELQKNGAIILDVRSRREYQGGHIKGSVNISINSLSANLAKLKETNKPIITCCASGSRSAFAKSILKSHGFPEVYNGGSWYNLESKIKK